MRSSEAMNLGLIKHAEGLVGQKSREVLRGVLVFLFWKEFKFLGCAAKAQRERVAVREKIKSPRKAAKTKRTRKAFPCGTFCGSAPLCENLCFFALT